MAAENIVEAPQWEWLPWSATLRAEDTVRAWLAPRLGCAADAIAFGRPFIGNPDLVERIRTGADWAADDPQTWYAPGPVGYTDYPVLQPA